MATHTIKTGSSVIIKDTRTKGIVSQIENGVYKLKGSRLGYSAGDLEAEKVKPAQKKKSAINQVSAQQKILNAIYSIIRPQFLSHNKVCRARYDCCTYDAREIHHMYSRKGFWLIITKYMIPVCRRCHRRITKNSKEAFAKGLSIPRTANLEYEFNALELSLLAKNGLNAPN